MIKYRTWSRRGRNIYILRRIHTLAVILFIFFIIIATVLIVSRVKSGVSNEKRDILRVWNAGDFEQTFLLSKNALLQKPVDNFLLSINGFSAYQLGISQINNQNMLFFINECIFSLRKALIHKESADDARLYYVLGKAYGYKGKEYSDLVIKNLLMANNLGYEAQDIPEYLGLAYAASGDYRNSVAAFSQAFHPEKIPSDSLLLSIARSYIAMEEYDMALNYLMRCIEISPDSKSIIIARMLLAQVFSLTRNFNSAEEQYFIILTESGENAEVRFQLGELYNMMGDITRARAEWRLAFRLDPAHSRARARLN